MPYSLFMYIKVHQNKNYEYSSFNLNNKYEKQQQQQLLVRFPPIRGMGDLDVDGLTPMNIAIHREIASKRPTQKI